MKKLLPIFPALILILSLCFSACDLVLTPDVPDTETESVSNEGTQGESVSDNCESRESSNAEDCTDSEKSSDEKTIEFA